MADDMKKGDKGKPQEGEEDENDPAANAMKEAKQAAKDK